MKPAVHTNTISGFIMYVLKTYTVYAYTGGLASQTYSDERDCTRANNCGLESQNI